MKPHSLELMYLERADSSIHTSWLQNFHLKLRVLRREKRRGLAFYTGTSCLKFSSGSTAVVAAATAINRSLFFI